MLRMRSATSLAALRIAKPTVVIDKDAGIGYWAPELHHWGGGADPGHRGWYIYVVNNASRIQVLRSASGNPGGPTWTDMGFIANAGNMSSDAIDPNVLHHPNGKKYLIVKGAMMWLTELETPWSTTREQGGSLALPLLKCTRPTHEQWYEAPATLVRKGKIWLMYSRCNTGPDYELMLAYVGISDDVTNASHWKHYSTEPVIVGNGGDCTGPGHNGWFTSPDGEETWLVYHCTAINEPGRSSRAMKLSFDDEGWPVFPSNHHTPPLSDKLPEPSR